MRPSKRDELVAKALTVFYRDGFHATGMDKLVSETGVSKTSMYNHFRTKEDLILAVLRLRDEQFRSWFCRRVEALADQPRAQLTVLFDVLGEWFDQPEFRGCMFIKATAEYQEPDHPIHVQSAEHKRLLWVYLREVAAEAGVRDPDRLARQLLLLKEGAIVTAGIGGDGKRAAADAREAAAALISIAFD